MLKKLALFVGAFAGLTISAHAEWTLVFTDRNLMTHQVRTNYYVDFATIKHDPLAPGFPYMMMDIGTSTNEPFPDNKTGKQVFSTMGRSRFNCDGGQMQDLEAEYYSTPSPSPAGLLSKSVRATPQNHGMEAPWVGIGRGFFSETLYNIACGKLHRSDFK